ncbi:MULTISPECIES: SDR family NAD(P)-dependent oxidoreductase [Gordonia]|uniref:Short-chain dehydorgenase/reductase n=1 Tax=Gordonia terrae C-6 TaxID=1316928 RepID=R7Y934_9ACTN|nr:MULTISPECIES: SDR family NAD(P)-dependent oxidoreductase [Gordonia]EON32244.1 short-chain dehydorgenase/reductase [Gordonia terrae C-6]
MVITGAGAGMGRALARRFDGAGVELYLVDVDVAAVRETVRLCDAGARVHVDQTDVSDADAMTAYADAVVDESGPPAMVFNNAGITMVAGVLEEDDDYARRIMSVNLGGVVNGTVAFLPHLEAAGSGSIVNTSSAFGFLGSPAQSAYSASKFATRGYSETIQHQLRAAGSGVRVHVVHPGVVHTEIAARARYVTPGVRDFVTRGFDHRLPGTRPAAAAAAILDGVLAGRDRIPVGLDARALDVGVRLLAGALQRPVATLTRPVFRRILGQATFAGTLRHPDPGLSRSL